MVFDFPDTETMETASSYLISSWHENINMPMLPNNDDGQTGSSLKRRSNARMKGECVGLEPCAYLQGAWKRRRNISMKDHH